MSKSLRSIIIIVVLVIVAIVLIVWKGGSSGTPAETVQDPLSQVKEGSTAPLPTSGTTKVSSSLSKYENAELGFSVQYPSGWEKEEMSTGVKFILPIDHTQVSTVGNLQADITVSPGKCAFPPVTTVNDRQVVKVGSLSFNMISMSNSVQGRSYFNRMYSLEHSGTCYLSAFSFISLSPESKGLSGSNLTQAQNNNKAIMNTADAAFTDMVKTFAFVAPPAGKDETQAPK